MPEFPQGMVTNIQKFSLDDGPGIRTTVFLKGCNLSCHWCHNPENIPFASEAGYGQLMSIDDVIARIAEDRPFYQTSGGGATFSGGEPLMQPDFLQVALERCADEDISTAVDTAGNVPYELLERISPLTELFLYDVKMADSNLHKQVAGAGNERILENLRKLLNDRNRVWVRVPVIPVYHTVDELSAIARVLGSMDGIERIELLPYHAYGVSKYAGLGREYFLRECGVPGVDFMENAAGIFRTATGTEVYIS